MTSILFKNSKECLSLWWALLGQVYLGWDMRWPRPSPNFSSRERNTPRLWLGTVIGRMGTAPWVPETVTGRQSGARAESVWLAQPCLFQCLREGCALPGFTKALGPNSTIYSNQKPCEEVESHLSFVSFCSVRRWEWLKTPWPVWFVNKLCFWRKEFILEFIIFREV